MDKYESFSAGDMARFDAMLDKHWARVDPTTQKAHASNKDSFWQITDLIPGVKVGENMNAPRMNFRVQRYHRAKTYEAGVGPDSTRKQTRHVAWNELSGRGELVSPGAVTVEYDDFLKQFVEDK
jgi:hypothetical protein